MAGICTSTVSPSGCGHRNLTIVLDGSPVVLSLFDVAEPLTTEEREQFLRLAIRRVRSTGVTLAQFLNRVCVGDEATNVKWYDLISVGSAITKTNIGTAYVDVLPGLNGQRGLLDFTGCTQYRLVLNANLVGTGAFGARVVRDSDNTVLHENANLGAAGERELDTGWLTLPAAFAGQAETLMRVQAKSVTAADDPIFRRCIVGLK